MSSVIHNIPPVFDENSKVLILGSFPSPKSREQGFFYGHPQNRMWRILAQLFSEPIPSEIEEKKSLLINNHIAMWDVLQSCEIYGASDASIKNPVVNNFDIIFETSNINAVFTTGDTATNLYNKLTGNNSIALPSPSPANAAMSLQDLIEKYQVIKKYITKEGI